MQSDTMKPDPALGQIFFKDADGNFIAVDEDHPLPTSGGGTTGDITIAPGDVQIGAVEIKDGATDQRAAVDVTGQQFVRDNAVLAAVDGLEGLLTTQAGYLDGIEGKLDTLHTDLTNDSEIGAVELKSSDSNNRALVNGNAELLVHDAQAATAGAATTSDDIAVDASAGGVTLIAANAARKGFIVQNTGADPIRVSIGSAPTVTHGIQLKAGDSLSMSAPFCPTGDIKAIREGANSSTASRIEVV